MIVTENFNVGERDFIRTYSNEGRYVVRDGESYSEQYAANWELVE